MSRATDERTAGCPCGQLRVACRGEPVRISVCHCLDCQRRSGAPFAAQARFPAENVRISGRSRAWTRTGESGAAAEFHFCETCGATVWYCSGADAGTIAVPVGAFADPAFPPPRFSVYEERRHPWVEIVGEGIAHRD